MAPVMTMINHFYDHPEVCRSLYLISGFKNYDAVLFRDEAKKFAQRFHVITTLDNEEREGFATGMVTAHIGKVPIREFDDYNIVIVGPPVMMHFAALECLKNGASEDKIWVSFERKMCCGIGKCGTAGSMIRTYAWMGLCSIIPKRKICLTDGTGENKGLPHGNV